MSSVLSFNRLKKLIIHDLVVNRKIIAITAIVISIVWALAMLVAASFEQYIVTLCLVGFVMTSRSFKELHNPSVTYHYLTLPCSNFERFLSKWLLTAVIFPVALMMLFFAIAGFCYWVLGAPAHYFDFLYDSNWHRFAKYLIVHSIFFMGAIFFKRYAFMKTLLACSLPSILITLLSGAVLMYSFPFWVPATIENFNALSIILFGLFWFALAPFCLIVSYLRLTECEIE